MPASRVHLNFDNDRAPPLSRLTCSRITELNSRTFFLGTCNERARAASIGPPCTEQIQSSVWGGGVVSVGSQAVAAGRRSAVRVLALRRSPLTSEDGLRRTTPRAGTGPEEEEEEEGIAASWTVPGRRRLADDGLVPAN